MITAAPVGPEFGTRSARSAAVRRRHQRSIRSGFFRWSVALEKHATPLTKVYVTVSAACSGVKLRGSAGEAGERPHRGGQRGPGERRHVIKILSGPQGDGDSGEEPESGRGQPVDPSNGPAHGAARLTESRGTCTRTPGTPAPQTRCETLLTGQPERGFIAAELAGASGGFMNKRAEDGRRVGRQEGQFEEATGATVSALLRAAWAPCRRARKRGGWGGPRVSDSRGGPACPRRVICSTEAQRSPRPW